MQEMHGRTSLLRGRPSTCLEYLDKWPRNGIGSGAGPRLGPFLAGVLFDRLGGYTLAFSLMGGSIVLSSLIVTATAARHPRSASG